MKPTETRNVASIGELCRGDVVRHKVSGQTVIVDANYGEYAIGITHQHISNPAEWEIVVAGVQHKERVEASELMPEGWYTLEIEDAVLLQREAESKSLLQAMTCHPRVMLKCKVVSAESPWLRDVLVGRPVKHSFPILGRAKAVLQNFLKAIDLEPEQGDDAAESDVLSHLMASLTAMPGKRFDCYVYVVGSYNAIRQEQAVRTEKPVVTGPYRWVTAASGWGYHRRPRNYL